MKPHTTCPRCGAELNDRGLCPSCLFAAAAESDASPARPEPPTPVELAPHFPSYDVQALVGRGGMGSVYRATHRSLGRTVALKVLAAEIAERPGFAERFAREARVLASLDHPNIVAVHDHGRAGPHWYLTMEYVEGTSLRELMRTRSVAPIQALALVGQICDALQYAHERSVVHRDIKPENILVDRRGQVRILDFGLSKIGGERSTENLTRADQVMGTPHYMAPEQWERPAEVDHRADIFAVGVVFYELLTGELPLGRFAPPSHRVAIDVRLDAVVLRSLEHEPERRYQQAAHVKTDVERATAQAPLRAVSQPGPSATAPRASSGSSDSLRNVVASSKGAARDIVRDILAWRARPQDGSAASQVREPIPAVLYWLLAVNVLVLILFSVFVFAVSRAY